MTQLVKAVHKFRNFKNQTAAMAGKTFGHDWLSVLVFFRHLITLPSDAHYAMHDGVRKFGLHAGQQRVFDDLQPSRIVFF